MKAGRLGARLICSAALAVLLPMLPARLSAQAKRVGYSLDQVLEMLKAGVSPRTALVEASNGCISFEIGTVTEARIRTVVTDETAARALINGLRDVCRISPQAPPAPQPNQVRASTPIFNPSAAFLRGLVVPGLGVFYVKRPVRGTVYVALAAGAIGYGATTCKEMAWDEFAEEEFCAKSELVPLGLLGAGAIGLVAALDAARIASSENRKAAGQSRNENHSNASGVHFDLPVLVPSSRGLHAHVRLRF